MDMIDIIGLLFIFILSAFYSFLITGGAIAYACKLHNLSLQNQSSGNHADTSHANRKPKKVNGMEETSQQTDRREEKGNEDNRGVEFEVFVYFPCRINDCEIYKINDDSQS